MGEQIGLDVVPTATGYNLNLHERHDFFPVQWANVHCPGTSMMEAGATLMSMVRRADGTFAVTVNNVIMYSVGPNGALGTDPTVSCVMEPRHYTGTFVDRAGAIAANQAQAQRFNATHDQFLVLDPGIPMQGCPVPEDAKRTCMSPWPSKFVLDTPLVDSDADAIPDEWEINGVPLGANKLDIKAMGAKPDHKDLFIQMDATDATKYPDDALAEIRRVFDTLPISNPDGHTGIHLHLDAGANSVMDADSNRWGSLSRANQALSIPDHFSTFPSGDCSDSDQPDVAPMTEQWRTNLEPIRAKVFRYALIVKYLGPSNECHTGINWTSPSRMFLIADFTPAGGKLATPMLVATFLHELGHSLGLDHGGGDGTNYKPNYQSLMNYAYLNGGIWARGQTDGWGRNAYSAVDPTPANTIDEATLDDRSGFPTATALPGTQLTYQCDTGPNITPPSAATDLNCDDEVTSAPNDITKDNGVGPTQLKTFNDVTHLHLALDAGGSGGFAPRPEKLRVKDALKAVGKLMKDKKVPTVKLSLRKLKGKRVLTIKAKDDVGLASAIVTSGPKTTAVSLSDAKKLKRDANVSVDVELTGDVTVVVNDVSDKSATATVK